MDSLRKPEVISALKQLSADHHGILKPEQVIAAAESESSPLHSYFTWNDGEAAAKYRLHEARMLLSVCVEYIGQGAEAKEQRVFVSLRSDRLEGGYRQLVKVLNSASMRKQLMTDALEEMKFFQEKYKSLRGLMGVFAAMDRASLRMSAKKKSAMRRDRVTQKVSRASA